MIRIGLDPGHGGRDPGAVYKGRKESEDALALSLAVAESLRSYGVDVGISRTSDEFVGLQQRARLSNEREDDYFISIHRNAFEPETAQGVETYVHPKADPHAVSLAQRIQNGLRDLGFTDRGVKMANFQVLRETQAPAVLVEVGFIDHTKDNQLFDVHRKSIADAIRQAILDQLGIPTDEQEEVSLQKAIAVLARYGIINSPEYWEENARNGKVIRGDNASLLLKRMASFIGNEV